MAADIVCYILPCISGFTYVIEYIKFSLYVSISRFPFQCFTYNNNDGVCWRCNVDNHTSI